MADEEKQEAPAEAQDKPEDGTKQISRLLCIMTLVQVIIAIVGLCLLTTAKQVVQGIRQITKNQETAFNAEFAAKGAAAKADPAAK